MSWLKEGPPLRTAVTAATALTASTVLALTGSSGAHAAGKHARLGGGRQRPLLRHGRGRGQARRLDVLHAFSTGNST